MVEALPIIVIVLGYVVFQMYRGYSDGEHPYAMQYHRSGVPHQVGLITAVHFEKKRFKTLQEAVVFTKELCTQGYAVVYVDKSKSPEKAGFSVEMARDANFKPLHYRVSVWGPIGITQSEMQSTLGPKPNDA